MWRSNSLSTHIYSQLLIMSRRKAQGGAGAKDVRAEMDLVRSLWRICSCACWHLLLLALATLLQALGCAGSWYHTHTANHPQSPHAIDPQVQQLASLKVLKESSKPCPGCRVAIEKTEGCNKMICAYCATCFCWRCEVRGPM